MKRYGIWFTLILILAVVFLAQAGIGAARSGQSIELATLFARRTAIAQKQVENFADIGLFEAAPGPRAALAVETCTDSDGGQVFDVKGYVEGIGRQGFSYQKFDVCLSADSLKEFYCNGTTPWPVGATCPNGCADGACLPPPGDCTDADEDGYAVEGGSCGLVDCDDTNPFVNPGASEVCGNGLDDDCNGLTDTEDPACLICTDEDGDGYAREGGTCGQVDCNDSDPSVNPGASEVCGNGLDDDCNALIDDADPACFVCTDADGDGYSIEGGSCGPVDCDDTDPSVSPGAIEACDNGVDDNCNGLADAEDPVCSAPPNIIVVGWDGTQRDHFWECYNKELAECTNGLPNIQALSGGVIYNSTTTSGGTATKPGWAQIFSGYNAEVTGVYSNGIYQPIPLGYTVFEKIENYFGDENMVTMFISGKDVHTGAACVGEPTTKDGRPVIEDQGQPWCLTRPYLDYYENDLRLNSVVGNRALELLELHQNDQFFALFLFRVPDVYGHIAGENSADYTRQLIDDDVWLGRIMAKLDQLGISDRTLIYVTSDHGFDEGLDRHGNAPYTIYASNDPLIVRSGDRKDLAPTILERYGITTGAIGSAPAVDGYSLYSIPSLACVPEGGAYIDYEGAPVCCAGLSLINLDMRSGPYCIAATGGTGDNSGFCTACGNGVCQAPENSCNCPADCQ